MAERALILRRALQRLFIDVEEQWLHRGSVASQRQEILAYKLIASEWQIITALQHILKQFAIATDQLQGDPSTKSPNTGRFDEYLPTVELLLDHLETAVNGWIIGMSSEATSQGFDRVNIFEDLLAHNSHTPILHTRTASNYDNLLRNGPTNPSFVESLFETRMAETPCLLRKAHISRLRRCCCDESLSETRVPVTPLESDPRSSSYRLL
jgi:hypothetical protein